MDVVVLEACRVDVARRCAVRADGVLPLTEQEVALLVYLAERPGRTVAREELLAEVMGYAAAVVTRALDAAISRLRQKIERDSGSPTHLHTVRGVGYRFEPHPAPVPRDAEPPSGLPPELDDLVGRDAEVDAALEGLGARDGALVTLLGGPGAGTSRLALGIAHRAHPLGHVVHVGLAGVRDPADAARALAAALGAAHGPVDAEARIDRVLTDGVSRVVVADGVDGDALGAAIGRWRLRARATRWLVTARAPLRHAGERRIPVGPLAGEDGVALLRARAEANAPGWSAGADEALARIVVALDGNPLALELAAARAPVVSPVELARAVSDAPFAVLSGLERALGLAWEALAPDSRAALGRCAPFDAPFTAAQARTLDDALGLEALQALVERSVLRATVDRGVTRFSLDATVRRFVRAACPALEGLRDALAHQVADLGEALTEALGGDRGADAARELAAFVPHALPALRDALARAPGDRAARSLALRLALGLAAAWEVHGSASDRVASLDAALAHVDGVAPALVARARLARGAARRELADPGARADVEAALAGFDPSSRGAALAALDLATLDADVRSFDRALARIDAALRQAPADADLDARAHALLGRIALERGDLPSARAAFAHLEARARALGGWRLRVIAALRLAHVAKLDRRPAEALRRLDEAETLLRPVGARDYEALVDGSRVGLAMDARDLDAALGYAERALAAYRRTGDLALEGSALSKVAAVRVARGELALAREVCAEALAVAEARGDAVDLALAAANLGRCLQDLGDAAAALPLLRRAVGAMPLPTERAYFAALTAFVEAEVGERDAARASFAAAAAVLPDGPLLAYVAGRIAAADSAAGCPGAGDEARAALARGRASRRAADVPLRTPTNSAPASELDALEALLARAVGEP